MTNIVPVQFSDKQIAMDALKEPNVEGGVLLLTDREGMFQIVHFGVIQPYLFVGLMHKAMLDILDSETEEVEP